MLAIDIGNTRIKLALYDSESGKRLLASSFSTVRRASADEIAASIMSAFRLYGADEKVDGAIICSVVPTVTTAAATAVERHFGVHPLTVGPGVRTGLNIRVENAASVGSDIVVGAVEAAALFRPPLLIFNMGTATTVTAIDESGLLAGVAIMPGLIMGLDALAENASELVPISPGKVKAPFGRNTYDSINAGAVLGAAGAVDGYIDRAAEAFGGGITSVMTGGCAGFVTPYLRHKVEYRQYLCLDGLYRLWKANVKQG